MNDDNKTCLNPQILEQEEFDYNSEPCILEGKKPNNENLTNLATRKYRLNLPELVYDKKLELWIDANADPEKLKTMNNRNDLNTDRTSVSGTIIHTFKKNHSDLSKLIEEIE